MISAGIDVGSKNVHITIMNDGEIIIKEKALTGVYITKSAEVLLESMIKKAGIQRKDIERTVSTGNWGGSVSFADTYIPDMYAEVNYVNRFFPQARVIIAVGAEGIRIIKIDANGMILDFAINEKCAAGNGTFVDAMARALETTTPEMAEIALQSTQDIRLNSQCAVFGESEVVSLIHQNTSKPDIARAVCNAIARTVFSLAQSVGLETEIVMIGGGANNVGLIDSLKTEINMEITVPADPGFIGSIGAAYAADSGLPGKAIKAQDIVTLPTAAAMPVIIKQEEKQCADLSTDFWKWPETSFINPDIDWKKSRFITAGVDVGSVSMQTVVMADGELFAYSNTRTGFSSPEHAGKAISLALAHTDMTVDDIDYCISTGYGRVNVPLAQQAVSEIACIARGANFFYGPEVRTIIDMGGQDCKVIRVDDRGKVVKFLMNDKCAAGTGRGMEVFADLVRVPLGEIGPRSFRIHKQPEPIESTCVLFAKSEIIGLLDRGMPVNEVIAAYCMSMAHRVATLVKRLGIETEICITGGISKNDGIVKRIEQELGVQAKEKKWHNPVYHKKNYPFDTQISGCSGAALIAFDLLSQGEVKSSKGK